MATCRCGNRDSSIPDSVEDWECWLCYWDLYYAGLFRRFQDEAQIRRQKAAIRTEIMELVNDD